MSYKTQYPDDYKRIKTLSTDELYNHARVSITNNHYCTECYCCACLDEYRERTQVKRNVIKNRRLL